MEDINLNVGVGEELGESIIEDVNGVSILIHRSLRDLLHQIPITEVAIKVLNCVMWAWCLHFIFLNYYYFVTFYVISFLFKLFNLCMDTEV